MGDSLIVLNEERPTLEDKKKSLNSAQMIWQKEILKCVSHWIKRWHTHMHVKIDLFISSCKCLMVTSICMSSHAFSMLSTIYGPPQTVHISRTLIGINDIDHSDVVVASPVGAATPTTSSLST